MKMKNKGIFFLNYDKKNIDARAEAGNYCNFFWPYEMWYIENVNTLYLAKMLNYVVY